MTGCGHEPRRVGFTGTSRHPLTRAQLPGLMEVMLRLRRERGGDIEWHHGGARHADATAHLLARALGFRTVVHPGPASDPADFPGADVVLPVRASLDRDEDIARIAEELIAAPGQPREVRRSGTWATVRRAHRYGIPVTLILPSGARAVYSGSWPSED